MATQKLIQNSFNGGEWSPLLEGRVDIGKYRNAVRKLQNMLLYPHGAAKARPGFKFIQQCRENLPYDNIRKLILLFEGNFDDTAGNHTVTNNGCTLADGGYVGDPNSCYFDGADYFTIPDHDHFNFYQRDFFIQFNMKATVNAGTYYVIYHHETNANNYFEIRLLYPGGLATAFDIEAAVCIGGTETVILTTNVNTPGHPSPGNGHYGSGTWYHVAVGRYKKQWYLFVDQTLAGNSQDDPVYSDLQPANYTGVVRFGSRHDGSLDFVGYLDDIIVSSVCEHRETWTYDKARTSIPLTAWRLIPFQYSTEQAYMIELGHFYARFYRDQGAILSGGVPYEIDTPWREDDLADLQYCQSLDVLYVVHPNYPPVEISRTGHTAWTCTYMDFDPAPTKEQGHDPTLATQTMTPGATDGDGITFTCGADFFLSGDVGRIISGAGGRALITAYVSATQVTCDILTPFPSLSAIAATEWTLEGSPNDTLTPSTITPVGMGCVLTASSLDCFRAEDVGKLVYIYGGCVRIKKVISATSVRGPIIKELWQAVDPYDGTAPINGTKAWTIESAAWTPENGYPSACAFFEDRLFMGGTPTYPETVWGSATGNYNSFKVGIGDNKAVEFTLGGREINNIKWIEPRESLMIGAVSGEWKLGPEDKGAPLTPLNVVARQVSIHGCADMQPLAIRNSTLFLQRQGRKIRELTYRWEEDAWSAPDLTILAEHITKGGITDMAYQQEPLSIAWAVRADGVLLGLTYLRDEEVIGWHRHVTAGEFQNIAVIPGSGQDELWAIVKRNIAGTDKYFVEMMESVFEDDEYTFIGNNGANAFFVDCGLSWDGEAATTFTGLTHLNGMEVSILADGKVQPRQTVADGQIELDAPASVVHVGLPYRVLVQTMRPTLQKQDGTGQGRYQRIQKAKIRVMDSMKFKVGRDDSDAGLKEINAKAYPRLITGDVAAIMDTRPDTEGRMVIVQDDPAPLTLIALMLDLESEDV